MDIQITPMKSEGVERHLQVSVPVEAVHAAEERAAHRYASQVRLPGFRPGKAPAAMVRKRFAAPIRQAALETLVQDAYKEVLEREQFDLAAQPHIHDLHFDEGQPLTFTLHVEVKPKLELARTSGFAVTRPSETVTDEMVEEQLEQLRDQRAQWSPSDDRPMPNDMVTVVLATAEEGGEFPEGAEYRLQLGSGQAIPGIEELIMEAQPGETIERPVRWPDDFPDEAQRGTTKRVRVELKDVKRKTLPELDDAFARSVGDFESLDALRSAVRADLEQQLKREADSAVRQQLVDQIIEANAFDVPPSWVHRLAEAYAEAYQVPEEDRERFAQEFRPMAERQVRRDMVIDAIAEREGLKASEADVDDKVAEAAQERNMNPGQLYASLQKAGRLPEIERGITEEKVFKYLMEQNTVS
ncbi:MAG TPA: trigger factor [Gemmatimonadaceae bacterium]|nr:trigger factor [Gemmatimonadaceae bacterium]